MASPPCQRLWVWTLLVLTAQLPAALHKCVFDEVQSQVTVVTGPAIRPDAPPSQSTHSVPTGQQHSHSPGRRASPQPLSQRRGAPPQPIRIQIWVSRESSNLSQAEKERLEPAVEEAVGVVSSLLSVRRVPGPLLLRRDINKYCKFLWKNPSTANYNRCGRANRHYRTETCLDVTIPDDHLDGCDVYPEADSPLRTVLRPEGAGVPDTDFLLYLHVQSTDKCRSEPGVLAYAVHCQTDTQGRPLAGVVVICRDTLTRETFSHRSTVQTVIHELFHALGFSKDLFSTWRDCSSSSQAAVGCSPRGRVAHTDGSGQTRIYTQSVVSAMQSHLRSIDPELGGPLENLDAGPGGVSSHWESRVLQGSIMAAALEHPALVRIDPVTLAALQDTGWYSVNLSRAQSLVWGEGEGATFGSLSTCHNNSSSFFCSGSALGCHYLHLHKGECQTDQYLEGCRTYKPLKNGSECWKEENERRSVERDWSGEIYGPNSRCFFSNLTRKESSLSPNSSVEGRCYTHRCVGPNRYQIQVSGSEWMDCPAGGAIQVQGYQGLVLCPDRRLCLYSDVTPPSDYLSTSPASTTTSDSHGTFTSAPSVTGSPANLAAVIRLPAELAVASVLGVTAAMCLLAAAVASYRKHLSPRVRVHAAPQDPGGL
ncbi:leishmanolysin-like peptidase 2 [Myripristis murdjan]|uniref:leishmanolysin-like peptidase 2 n=1 Tax=Myripristis murdjan TaxID=586833 RepID=UPI001176153B|nr:leishmanolysin-like peptidase 2 [Myripristis murdjan]